MPPVCGSFFLPHSSIFSSLVRWMLLYRFQENATTALGLLTTLTTMAVAHQHRSIVDYASRSFQFSFHSIDLCHPRHGQEPSQASTTIPKKKIHMLLIISIPMDKLSSSLFHPTARKAPFSTPAIGLPSKPENTARLREERFQTSRSPIFTLTYDRDQRAPLQSGNSSG